MAWLRRIIVSAGIGGVSYAIMFALMLLSVMYDRAFEPIITLAFDTGQLITNWLDPLVAGTYWGQVAVNHLRERVEYDSCGSVAARDCHRHDRGGHSAEIGCLEARAVRFNASRLPWSAYLPPSCSLYRSSLSTHSCRRRMLRSCVLQTGFGKRSRISLDKVSRVITSLSWRYAAWLPRSW